MFCLVFVSFFCKCVLTLNYAIKYASEVTDLLHFFQNFLGGDTPSHTLPYSALWASCVDILINLCFSPLPPANRGLDPRL